MIETTKDFLLLFVAAAIAVLSHAYLDNHGSAENPSSVQRKDPAPTSLVPQRRSPLSLSGPD